MYESADDYAREYSGRLERCRPELPWTETAERPRLAADSARAMPLGGHPHDVVAAGARRVSCARTHQPAVTGAHRLMARSIGPR